MISFEEFLLENKIEDQIAKYQKEKAYIQKTGKLPKTAERTDLGKYGYYDYITDKIIELQHKLENKVDSKILENENFKKWFKNSKAVDEIGNPMIFYHGTSKLFNQFKKEFVAVGVQQYGPGYYFTNKSTTAITYAADKNQKQIHQVHLSIQKPLDAKSTKKLTQEQIERFILLSPDLDDALSNYGEIDTPRNKQKTIQEAINNVFDSQDDLLRTLFSIGNDFYKNYDSEFLDAITKILGYDGIIIEQSNNEIWFVAFRPNQIKSVHGNIRYNKKSDDLFESVDIEVDYKKWKSLVNMSVSELEKFIDSEEGKVAGLTKEKANQLGIKSGKESASWILRMKQTKFKDWTPEMKRWANRQISFISRMSGNTGPLYNEKKQKTRKHLSLLIWGHNPEK